MNGLAALPSDSFRLSFVIPERSGSVQRLLPRRGQDEIMQTSSNVAESKPY